MAPRLLGPALLAFLLAAAPAGAKTVPKGTPYAAEVTAEVTGTVTITRDQDGRTENVCEAEPQLASRHDSYTLNWKARFPHVTVPVAGSKELGKAFKRLHVPVQPTSDGTGGLAGGGYSIGGSAPTAGDKCDAHRYEASGRLTGAPLPPGVGERNVTVVDDGTKVKRTLVGFYLGTVDAADPAKIPDGDPNTSDEVSTLFSSTLGALPDAPGDLLNNLPPRANGLTLDVSYAEFRPLLHRSSVSIDVADAGTTDCGRVDPGIATLVCSTRRDIRYTVKLEKKKLYETVRAYPR